MADESVAELFRCGHLAEAILAAAAVVKKSPEDLEARGIYAVLLMFRGEWDRADAQLGILQQLEVKTAYVTGQLRNLIRAEIAREQCFLEGRVPELPFGDPPALRAALRSLIAAREGDSVELQNQVAAIESSRPKLAGTANGKSFVDLRDADDVVSPVLEVCATSGVYWWVPWEQVRSLAPMPAKEYVDRLWAPMKVALGGFAGVETLECEVRIPMRYVASHRAETDSLRLGRSVSWRQEAAGANRGCGAKILWAGSDEIALLELQRLELAPPGSSEG